MHHGIYEIPPFIYNQANLLKQILNKMPVSVQNVYLFRPLYQLMNLC